MKARLKSYDKVGNILIMENSAALKTSRQEFAYDDLYRLTGAKGIYRDKTISALEKRNEYTQTFVYDDIGNMTHKTSYNYKWSDNSKPEHLNYNLAYHYAATHPHRATRIGEMYYTYDGNGNVIRISNKPGDGQNSSNSNSDTFKPPMDTGANTGWAGVAYGREPGGSGGGNEQATQYKWDEENRLIHARVNGNEIDFLYNAGGERTAKYGKDGEVIYYDKMFQVKTNVSPLHITKHIFLGSTRVVSKLSHELGPIDLEYEKRNAYYYHGDHLGSSNYVTDYEGNEYEHYEYTPYGEMWVEEESDSLDKINFKFTSKELDEETGLYYFGARYLDAKASRWLSCDPILGDYLPIIPIDDEAKKYNKNLPGMGGVFNPINLNSYQYAGNNPLSYIDPDGKLIVTIHGGALGSAGWWGPGGRGKNSYKAMNRMTEALFRLYTDIVDNVNYDYGGPGENWNDPAYNRLKNIAWIGKSKVLAGWSVGADAVARYMNETNEAGFDLVIIDGANIAAYLTEGKINTIASKTDKLIIITHNKDEMIGFGFGKRNSKFMIDNKKLPENVLHIMINDNHTNKKSSEIIEEVIRNWDSLKKHGNKIKY